MQTKELLLKANQQCFGLVMPLLEDLKSAALVTPTSNGGNHAHWVLGHLVVSEGQFRSMMRGIENPFEGWQSLFSGGSQPAPSGQGYPGYEELLQRLGRLQQETITWMESLTEADLDQASKIVPPGFESFFGTWRQVLLMRAMHWMNHRGQLADGRRAAGRVPLMV